MFYARLEAVKFMLIYLVGKTFTFAKIHTFPPHDTKDVLETIQNILLPQMSL